MKASVQKQTNISILPAALLSRIQSKPDVESGSIRESFDNWLQSVVRPTQKSVFAVARQAAKLPKLTVGEIMRVNDATVREGESHCVWPPSVVQFFQSAEVITVKKTRHYELKDASLRKVG